MDTYNPKVKKGPNKYPKYIELDRRVTKLEQAVFKPDPTSVAVAKIRESLSVPNLNDTTTTNSTSSPSGGSEEHVYDRMRLWLASPASRRVDDYPKSQSASNEVRQVLFLRNQKAIQKYGEGLKITEAVKCAKKIAEKLADGAFFLSQALFGAGVIGSDDMKVVDNLHTLLGLLIKEHKNKHQ